MSTNSKVEHQDFETYLKFVENSVGSNMWRNGMAKVDGKMTDILNNGEISCAMYISTILMIFEVTKRFHGNVGSTVKDMEESGWQKVSEPQPGDIIFYGPKPPLKGMKPHDHLGFYIGDEKIVTNNILRSKPEEGGLPSVVDWLYRDHPDGQREMFCIYRGKHLFRS